MSQALRVEFKSTKNYKFSTKSSKKKTRKKRSSTATSTDPSTSTSSTSGKSDAGSEKTAHGAGVDECPSQETPSQCSPRKTQAHILGQINMLCLELLC